MSFEISSALDTVHFTQGNKGNGLRLRKDQKYAHWGGTGIRRVLLLRSITRDATKEPFIATYKFLRERDIEVVLDRSDVDTVALATRTRVEKHENPKTLDFDLAVCIGGDGLLLYACMTFFQRRAPPVLCFNMGSLGFLTSFPVSQYEHHLQRLITEKRRNVTLRMRLQCVVHRSEQSQMHLKYLPERGFGTGSVTAMDSVEEHVLVSKGVHVLNEIVIDRGPAPYLSNLECYCDGHLVTRVQADGLIIATPTGSTAYSLSASGSMVHPGVPAILFTPVCPHSLSFRPVVFPNDVTLVVKVPEDARAAVWVSFDGRNRVQLSRGDFVSITSSAWAVPTLNLEDSTVDWFRSATECLRWNERVVQGNFSADDKEMGGG